MAVKRRERVRNADKARKSFVTRRAEIKLGTLADIFKLSAGKNCTGVEKNVLSRRLTYTGFHYLDKIDLLYNWENRFLSVNYNLQIIAYCRIDREKFIETGNARFVLDCRQKGLTGQREFSWEAEKWNGSDKMRDEYIRRLSNPLITERLSKLDIFEMEIEYNSGDDYWKISCESLVGSATWILIPPVTSLITPKPSECVMLYEAYELIGDAVIFNR